MLNVTKSNYMIFHAVHTPTPEETKLVVSNEAIKKQTSTKFLGIYLDENLKWTYQINFIGTKLSKSLDILRANTVIACQLSQDTILYYSLPILDLWHRNWERQQKNY